MIRPMEQTQLRAALVLLRAELGKRWPQSCFGVPRVEVFTQNCYPLPLLVFMKKGLMLKNLNTAL